MYNTLVRRGTTFAFIIGFVISLFIIITTVSGVGPDVKPDDFEALREVGAFGTSVSLAIILTIIAIAAILLGGVWGFITYPKSALKFVIGLVGLLVLVGIAYAMSEDETTGTIARLTEQYDIQGTISRMISAGILVTIILLVLGLLTMLLGEIRNLFN